MRRFPLYLLAVAMLAPALSLHAQGPGELPAARKALLEDVAELMRTRVFPVMSQWRLQFDAALAPRDRSTLESMRERYSMLQDNIRKNLEARRSAWDKRDYRSVITIRSLLQTNYQDRQKLFNDASRMAERYDKSFTYLNTRIDSTVEEWRGASMRIFIDWFARHRSVISPAMNTPQRDDLARLMASCKNIGLDQLHDRGRISFLLWDGEDFTASVLEAGIPESPLYDCAPGREQVLFIEPPSPNPFVESTQIRFLLPSPGHTSVRMFNSQGREVRTLLRDQLPAGKHLATVQGAGLPTGNYFVLVESQDSFDAVSIRLGR
jgi:hypothetical protein